MHIIPYQLLFLFFFLHLQCSFLICILFFTKPLFPDIHISILSTNSILKLLPLFLGQSQSYGLGVALIKWIVLALILLKKIALAYESVHVNIPLLLIYSLRICFVAKSHVEIGLLVIRHLGIAMRVHVLVLRLQ